ncbi:chorismate synthase [Striga asiatica]|uniref:Chorismate synthase n=1 Tax=Striga asiatica TaxID=4170 RepID=A0A5A7RJB0_STRAF|nr:chorismate synthase [Striga asiatica]
MKDRTDKKKCENHRRKYLGTARLGFGKSGDFVSEPRFPFLLPRSAPISLQRSPHAGIFPAISTRFGSAMVVWRLDWPSLRVPDGLGSGLGVSDESLVLPWSPALSAAKSAFWGLSFRSNLMFGFSRSLVLGSMGFISNNSLPPRWGEGGLWSSIIVSCSSLPMVVAVGSVCGIRAGSG